MAVDVDARPFQLCSTPSGVEGSITPADGATARRTGRVLNAFRRRRFHHEIELIERLRSRECSTPSGVEGSITGSAGSDLTPGGVLNAFRRRRFHHLERRRNRLRDLQVLNAFRRRRFHHQRERKQRLVVDPVCSTPSGVEGSITLCSPAGARVSRRVLNAFRRRRFHHCRPRGRRSACTGAQRLPASKVPSHDLGQSAPRQAVVLNAFRRRRFHHPIT